MCVRNEKGNKAAQKLPEKQRLIVQRLCDFADNDMGCPIALVAGIRRVGKTTALQQLAKHYGNSAVFVDLSRDIDFNKFLDVFIENPKKLLLLDEITHLSDFEETSQQLYNLATRYGFRVVMTGSSSAHITRLSTDKLGGGRARLFRLPPVTFIEYLYMTDRIASYTDYDNVSNDYFADYLMLKGLTPALRIQFDAGYFDTFYREVEESNEKRGLSSSLIDLKENDLLNMSNLIAYKLGEPTSYDKTVGHLLKDKIGRREYISLNNLEGIKTAKWSKIDLSDAFITVSHAAVRDITAEEKGRILHFLLWAGLAGIEMTKESTNAKLPDIGDVVSKLKNITKTKELQDLFDEVSICLTTPLFYTMLGTQIVARAGVDIENLCKGDLLGKMLEVYIRGAITLNSVRRIQSSVKLRYIDGSGEVDIYDAEQELLLEISCYDKGAKDVHLMNYMKDIDLLRVCSTDKVDSPYGCYHRIPYAKLCCMLDLVELDTLKKTKSSNVINFDR